MAKKKNELAWFQNSFVFAHPRHHDRDRTVDCDAGIDGDLMAAGLERASLPLSLAFTPEKAASMMTAWGDALTAEMKRSLLIDFIFIPGYVLLFFAITRFLALWHKGRLEAWGGGG